MQKCPKCGKFFDSTWKICLHCSVPLVLTNETPDPVEKKEGAAYFNFFKANLDEKIDFLIGLIVIPLIMWLTAIAMRKNFAVPLIAEGLIALWIGNKRKRIGAGLGIAVILVVVIIPLVFLGTCFGMFRR